MVMKSKIIIFIVSLVVFLGIGFFVLKVFNINIIIPLIISAIVFYFIATKNKK